jgi:hypothetical protein
MIEIGSGAKRLLETVMMSRNSGHDFLIPSSARGV